MELLVRYPTLKIYNQSILNHTFLILFFTIGNVVELSRIKCSLPHLIYWNLMNKNGIKITWYDRSRYREFKKCSKRLKYYKCYWKFVSGDCTIKLYLSLLISSLSKRMSSNLWSYCASPLWSVVCRIFIFSCSKDNSSFLLANCVPWMSRSFIIWKYIFCNISFNLLPSSITLHGFAHVKGL